MSLHSVYSSLAAYTVPAAGLMLAQASSTGLPDPNHWSSAGWVIAVVVMVATGANQVAEFYEKRMKERPTPSQTYLSREIYEIHQKQAEETRKELMDRIEELKETIKEYSNSNYEARKELHKNLNATREEVASLNERLNAIKPKPNGR